MYEHAFGSHGDAWATTTAAELAEAIVDEIARAGHSWSMIELMAQTLTLVAGTMTRTTPPPHA